MNGERGPEMEAVRPIAPTEVLEAKIEQIPNEVLQTFNSAIAENVNNGLARVLQKDIVAVLEGLGMNRQEIYKRHWLDVEDMYRQAGWEVKYDSPSYGDNDFEPYFVFRAPKAKL